MTIRNIYISTYTTFELIRILWSRQNELDRCPRYRSIKRWLLKREMKQIMIGFLSRELTSQSNALMNVLTGLHPTNLVSYFEDLTVCHNAGTLIIGIYYEVATFTPRLGTILYDAKKQTFIVDMEPAPNSHNGIKFTIEFGQKVPSSIMEFWQTTIVPIIEDRYQKALWRIVQSESQVHTIDLNQPKEVSQ